jgi:hypothetical protein
VKRCDETGCYGLPKPVPGEEEQLDMFQSPSSAGPEAGLDNRIVFEIAQQR